MRCTTTPDTESPLRRAWTLACCAVDRLCAGHSATDHRVGLGNHPQCRDDHDPDRDTEVLRIGHLHNEDQNDCGQPGQKDLPTVRADRAW